jgi:opacity protein-like surface antigen
MRVLARATMIGGLLALAAPAFADDLRGSIQGFGGVTLGSVAASDTAFGGRVTTSLTPNVQILGEAGRIGNVLPPTTSTLLAFSPLDFGVSAWYGEGGVRFTTGSGSVRPYVETTAGFARLHAHVNDLGSGVGGALARAGLRLLDRTDPVASAGGGVTLEAGRFVADVGYRYRRIFSSSWVDALALGDTLHTNEVRLGIGVRF